MLTCLRREFARTIAAGGLSLLLALSATACRPGPTRPTSPTRPNVLFIAVDDLNDWIGRLGGHVPHAVEDKLVERDSERDVLFREVPLLENIRGFRPLKQAQDNRAHLADDAFHEVVRIEDAVFDENGPESLLGRYEPAELGHVREPNQILAQQVGAETVVGRR